MEKFWWPFDLFLYNFDLMINKSYLFYYNTLVKTQTNKMRRWCSLFKIKYNPSEIFLYFYFLFLLYLKKLAFLHFLVYWIFNLNRLKQRLLTNSLRKGWRKHSNLFAQVESIIGFSIVDIYCWRTLKVKDLFIKKILLINSLILTRKCNEKQNNKW